MASRTKRATAQPAPGRGLKPGHGLDRLIGWLKWPSAIAMVLALPPAGAQGLRLIARVLEHPAPLAPILLGAAVYAVLWALVLRRRVFGTLATTLEHELTHALFAWMTFHRVSRLRATWRAGGSVVIHRGSNWLIALAPYWFPTAAVAMLAIGVIVPEGWRDVWRFAVGVSLAHHVTSTWGEIHPRQSDFRQAGPIFALLFLPGANLLTLGALLAGLMAGPWAALTFLTDVAGRVASWLGGS